nr:hypothetical protein [Mucilaginibacter sp. E4BP6]
MKNLLIKHLKKKTRTRYRFQGMSGNPGNANITETTGTDPTNTTIVVVTTSSNIF